MQRRRLVGLGALALTAGASLAAVARARRQAADAREAHRGGPPAVPLLPVDRRARSAQLATLGTKVGRAQLANRAQRLFASGERRAELRDELQLRTAAEVAETLGHMKGVMMKLGQMVSYVDESMPEALRDSLAQLQQDAPPMSAELAAGVVERDLGAPPEQVFAEWAPEPFAAASIGQVHRARTHDGRDVAVKVQYPGVDEAVGADLATTDTLTQMMRAIYPNLDPTPLAEEIRARILEELDYEQEARNQQAFVDAYRGHPFIHVPEVVFELSGARVLTTELADGVRFAEMEQWPQEERDLAAETIFRFVFRSLYRLHLFNGDPHPGNYLFRPGGQVTFLDFGLVKRFTPAEVRHFERFIETLILDPDPEAFRAALEASNAIIPGAPVTAEELVEAMAPYYELVLHHGEFTWTPEYASRIVRTLFDRSHPLGRHTSGGGSMFVVINRINLGLYGLFARLGATGNWRAIAEELWPMVDGPPATELGRKEAAWLAARGA